MNWWKKSSPKNQYLRKIRLIFDVSALVALAATFAVDIWAIKYYYDEREQVGSQIAIQGAVNAVAYNLPGPNLDNVFVFTVSTGNSIAFKSGNETKYHAFVKQNILEIVAKGDVRIDYIRVMRLEANYATYYGAIDNTNEFAADNAALVQLTWRLTGLYAGFSALVIGLSFLVALPAKKAWEKQADFVGNASHELKTPLAVIESSNQLLEQKSGENEYTKNIKDETLEMQDMINDLIEESHLERSRDTISPVSLSDLVNSLALSMDSVFYEKGITYEVVVEENLTKAINEKAFKTLFKQLINNAAKYCEGETKKVKVHLFSLDKMIYLSFFNTGCRLKENEREKIFNRFYRGEAVTNIPGSGLGLSIAEGIADLYGYDLDAYPKENVSFEIVLGMKKDPHRFGKKKA